MRKSLLFVVSSAATLFFAGAFANQPDTPEAGAAGTLQGDPTAGAALFNRCRACHSVEPNKMKIGPSLYGVVGRTPGALSGYNFSPAMIAFGEGGTVWDEATLDPYLEAPRDFIPNIKMIFPGVPDAQDRADLIAHLGSLSTTQGAE